MYKIEYKHSYLNGELIEELTYSDNLYSKYISKFINGKKNRLYSYMDGGLCIYNELLNGELHGVTIESSDISGFINPKGIVKQVYYIIDNTELSEEEWIEYNKILNRKCKLKKIQNLKLGN
tara:strand:+ start:442 stop:804 length:363 start_codon:yes stop_codon:yes gene_type:complete